ncbi:MAG TPA: hypothetical protein VI037_07115 [Nitrososphaera sp.]|jgi:hypothetical protein
MTDYTAIPKHHTMAPTISQNDKERKKEQERVANQRKATPPA